MNGHIPISDIFKPRTWQKSAVSVLEFTKVTCISHIRLQLYKNKKKNLVHNHENTKKIPVRTIKIQSRLIEIHHCKTHRSCMYFPTQLKKIFVIQAFSDSAITIFSNFVIYGEMANLPFQERLNIC